MIKRLAFITNVIKPEAMRLYNRVLTGLCALLFIVLLMDLWLVSPKREWMAKLVTESSATSKPPAKGSENLLPKRESYDYYSGPLSGKNIFGTAPAAQTKKTTAQSTLNNLALVGIISGANPQAILEDKSTQMTYYLTKSQSLDGITVEDIQERKVVLTYRGESLTFSL